MAKRSSGNTSLDGSFETEHTHSTTTKHNNTTGMRSRAGTEESVDSVSLDDDYSSSTGGGTGSGGDDDSRWKSKSKSKSKKSRTSSGSSGNSNSISTRIHHVLDTISHTLRRIRSRRLSTIQKLDGKQLLLLCLLFVAILLVWDTMFRNPQDRFIQPGFSTKFLSWVESHPASGLGAIIIVIAVAVVTMVPIGTPLTLGCGYIYRGVYGWGMGLFVATAVAMVGSAMGAVTCFLLGRYLMRERVQKWVRKYPLFDAIDVAASEHGLRIMAMLYLTPVLPLGLVSYMCGTTSMSIYSFTLAKIASLPLYLLYTFMGASAHSFVKKAHSNSNNNNNIDINDNNQEEVVAEFSAEEEVKHLEENEVLIVAGVILSALMMSLITRHIKKELMKILEQQKRNKPGEALEEIMGDDSGEEVDDNAVEMGLTARRSARRTKTDA